MSVREIPKKYGGLSGLGGHKKGLKPYFESPLERDLLHIVEFDHAVQSFDVQPVKVEWIDHKGSARSYYPDLLIEYFPGKSPFPKEIVLIEVKPRNSIKKNWLELKQKFKAAIKYAKQQGWHFKILSEVEIRSVYMENAEFLNGYLNTSLDESHERLILDKLIQLKQTTVGELADSIFKDKWLKAELIWSIWQMVALKRISIDVYKTLNMDSKIWLEF